MTTEEKLDKLVDTVQNLERVMRQGFAVLTELHADSQREQHKTDQAMQKLANSMSALADHVADQNRRLDNLEDK
jgi:hypothetical protein